MFLPLNDSSKLAAEEVGLMGLTYAESISSIIYQVGKDLDTKFLYRADY